MDDYTLVKWMVEHFLEKLQARLGNNLVSVVLFGSAARGNMRLDSDIDLLVICEKLPPHQLARQEIVSPLAQEIEAEAFQRLDKGRFHPINVILKTRDEASQVSPYYLDMTTDAIILYDRDGFFRRMLNRVQKRLQELGARKVYIGRMWYWDLKPDTVPGEVVEL